MLTDNSTQSFLRKLCEKQREHSAKLYTEGYKEKQNIHKQPSSKPSTTKKVRSESLPSVGGSNRGCQWLIDVAALQGQEMPQLVDDWLCLPEGVHRFHRVIRTTEWTQQIQAKVKQCEAVPTDGRKCIIIEINCLGTQINFTTLLTHYSLPLLKFGKSCWSVAALSNNKRFDLLSLDCEGSPLWKAKNPLSKVQLQRQQLMRRVFGYASEKQKNLNIQEILAKVTLSSNNIVYFVLKYPELEQPVSRLLIQQEIIIQNITTYHKYAIISLGRSITDLKDSVPAMKRLGVTFKKEEQLSKVEKQKFLKSIIGKLEGQLNSQKQELKQYIESEMLEEEQYPIPSQRMSMADKYSQLQRNIRESHHNR